jgi:hypothetical protein
MFVSNSMLYIDPQSCTSTTHEEEHNVMTHVPLIPNSVALDMFVHAHAELTGCIFLH